MPTYEQMMSPEGCGGGTENACFALVGDAEKGLHCAVEQGLKIDDLLNAAIAAAELGGRMNKDLNGDIICPSDDPNTAEMASFLSFIAPITDALNQQENNTLED